MALERSVLMGDGVVRRYHIISSIQHILNSSTIVEVVSYTYQDDPEQTGCHTTMIHDFDDTLTFSSAYDWISTQPEFEEYTSSQDDELVQMNARINELSDELAQSQESISNLNEAIFQSSEKLTNVLVVLTDDQAINFAGYFPQWESNKSYNADERVTYNGLLYRCVQAHTSQDTWTPDAVPALWTRIAFPDTIDEWRQPTGAHDAYQSGDKVTHNGQTWVSTADNNVWEPGVYGWEVSE